jgi:hypothetical protein
MGEDCCAKSVSQSKAMQHEAMKRPVYSAAPAGLSLRGHGQFSRGRLVLKTYPFES